MPGHYTAIGPAFPASAALAAHLRVILTSGELAVAGTTVKGLGTLRNRTLAAGEVVTLETWFSSSTHRAVASGAIAAEAEVFAGADGKVAATGTVSLGFAVTAAGADDDIIEFIPVW